MSGDFSRATMSLEPPGVNGTTRRTGLLVNGCATAVGLASASSAAVARMKDDPKDEGKRQKDEGKHC